MNRSQRPLPADMFTLFELFEAEDTARMCLDAIGRMRTDPVQSERHLAQARRTADTLVEILREGDAEGTQTPEPEADSA